MVCSGQGGQPDWSGGELAKGAGWIGPRGRVGRGSWPTPSATTAHRQRLRHCVPKARAPGRGGLDGSPSYSTGTHGSPISPATLSLEQLDAVIEQFIITEYHQRPHSETGETPSRRWGASGFIGAAWPTPRISICSYLPRLQPRKCGATGSSSPPPATSPQCSPPTSVSTSPSASTRATSSRSASARRRFEPRLGRVPVARSAAVEPVLDPDELGHQVPQTHIGCRRRTAVRGAWAGPGGSLLQGVRRAGTGAARCRRVRTVVGCGTYRRPPALDPCRAPFPLGS